MPCYDPRPDSYTEQQLDTARQYFKPVLDRLKIRYQRTFASFCKCCDVLTDDQLSVLLDDHKFYITFQDHQAVDRTEGRAWIEAVKTANGWQITRWDGDSIKLYLEDTEYEKLLKVLYSDQTHKSYEPVKEVLLHSLAMYSSVMDRKGAFNLTYARKEIISIINDSNYVIDDEFIDRLMKVYSYLGLEASYGVNSVELSILFDHKSMPARWKELLANYDMSKISNKLKFYITKSDKHSIPNQLIATTASPKTVSKVSDNDRAAKEIVQYSVAIYKEVMENIPILNLGFSEGELLSIAKRERITEELLDAVISLFGTYGIKATYSKPTKLLQIVIDVTTMVINWEVLLYDFYGKAEVVARLESYRVKRAANINYGERIRGKQGE